MSEYENFMTLVLNDFFKAIREDKELMEWLGLEKENKEVIKNDR